MSLGTIGTNGRDTLQGGTGDDILRGYLGDDYYDCRWDDGVDTIIDSGGTDTLRLLTPGYEVQELDVYRSGASLVFDFLGWVAVKIQGQFAVGGAPAGAIEFLQTVMHVTPLKIQNGLAGSADDDLIVGTAAADNIKGGAGRDWIFGGAGNDTLSGGSGDDDVRGGGGDDLLFGGDGSDTLCGGAGMDTLDGGTGRNTAVYTDGLAHGAIVNLSAATLTVGTVSVAAGTARDGGDGIDTLRHIGNVEGSAFEDYVLGSAANNHIAGSMGNDTLDGGAGDDTLYGDSDDDALMGGAGADWLCGGSGQDTLDGGMGGSDTAFYGDGWHFFGVVVNLSAAACTVDGLTLAAGTARDGWSDIDTLRNVENVIGSPCDDVLIGSAGANQLMGSRGRDTLDGGAGADTVLYDDVFAPSTRGVFVNLSATALQAGSVRVEAFSAIDGSGDVDVLRNIENARGGWNRDYLRGSLAANRLEGGFGHDTLDGGGGNDTLDGGDGHDDLRGGDGDDMLYGGAGQDFLTGSAGADTFVFRHVSEIEADVIDDATHGVDKIDLSGIDADPLRDGKQSFSFVSDGFTGAAGELTLRDGWLLLNTTEGDTDADYRIQLIAQPGGGLTESDFILQ